jgi:FecR protein
VQIRKRHLASLAVLLWFFGVSPLLAQDQSQDQSDPYAPYDSPGPGPALAPSPDQAQPPDQGQAPESNQSAPGMARLSFIHGDVSFQRGDNGSWEAATINTPIAVGDRVSVGSGGRTEIQLDYANALRLSDGATAKIAALSRENIQVQVGQGLTTYSVLRNGEANAEIDTPNAAIHPNGPGDYRISVMPDGSTEVVVREGSAQISEPQGSTQVDRGQMITIQGTDNPEYKISSAPASDAWDSWNQDRDHRIMSASSWRHTDPYYTGTQDLDQYGVWSEVPDYGPVWVPQQGPDWAPYSAGSWVWEPYWGWTWVSSEPWGWAPYHYGRWFVYGGNWVWWPGPVVAYPGYYPVWAPAYVSFFGWGGGVGFGIGFGFGWGFGHVGWLPCGPGDWFHPWWGGWGAHFAAYGIHNTTVINNYHNGFAPIGPRGEHSFSNVNEAFNNARVRSGFASMDSSRFGHAGVSPQRGIGAAEFRQASMISGRMPINPGRGSFSAAGHAASPASYRNAPSASQHFFTSASRGSAAFNARNTAHAQSGFSAARNSGAFNRTPSQSFGSRANGSASVQSSRPGWHTFTPPSSANRSQGFGSNERSNSYNSYRPQSNGYRSPASAPRSGYSNSYHSYSRPQLNMRQPVVTPRGGYRYGGSRPSYSAPRGSSNGGGRSRNGHSGGDHTGGHR